MSAFDPLSLPLSASAPGASRQVIAEILWNLLCPSLILHRQSHFDELYELYFRPNGYYQQQCRLFSHDKLFASVETHRQLLDVAQLIQQPLSRAEVLKLASKVLRPADQYQHDMSVNLAVRLMVMMKVGDVPHECIDRAQLEWKSGTLQEFVCGHFCKPRRRSHERLRLEKTFHALNLQRTTGVEIKWTDNLADHLQMVNDDKMVVIFRHASFLKAQINNPIYPRGFIDETLQTLALLFPQDDPTARKWFQKASRKAKTPLDRHIVKAGVLSAEARQFDNFQYWHDRLVVLKQVYDEARPVTIPQWWHDQRHPVEWYAIWTAVVVVALTVIFGLVQCVLSGLQVYIALKTMDKAS
ncbi:hypothetical protein B0H63DRAFT_470799 [Podospora didyma]|uniref:Uncharacterized protein n=1 Tax=Podospora didyma TaxID=330526 RepID=A0AAE0U1N4_9PEZI|nr:hypothetical protein B0H63DRAFT_470799 [Podospora didyma]